MVLYESEGNVTSGMHCGGSKEGGSGMRFFRKKREVEVEDEAVIQEACRYLAQIGIEAAPIARDSSDDIGPPSSGADSVGSLAIKGKNLDAIHLYTAVETTGTEDMSTRIRYYYIDYLVRANMKTMGRRNCHNLEARTIHKWQGSILKPAQRELRDLKWCAGRPSLLSSIFRVRRESVLTNALNSDIALKGSLIQEFKKPLVRAIEAKWSREISWSTESLDIVADWGNSCFRIKLPKKARTKEALPAMLPSPEFMETLDGIAYHIPNATQHA
jgi:hypothetical protein